MRNARTQGPTRILGSQGRVCERIGRVGIWIRKCEVVRNMRGVRMLLRVWKLNFFLPK